ncbi:hypothetical protein VNI00_004502 [Paramarasmius palmivorus]|uniref:Uncharacterized protein n=1 Tax=Paramarasmius palmivorus TaxID=297713 RepID=A0AAW0DLN9_9AGAR
MVPDGLRGNDAWSAVSSIVSRTDLLIINNNTDISISDLSAMEKEIIEATRMLRDSFRDPYTLRVSPLPRPGIRFGSSKVPASNINIVHIVRSGNSSNSFNVNSNNSYSALYSDESDADDTQSISLPQSSIPTNFENNDPRPSERGFGSTEFSTAHSSRVPPSQNFQPSNRGVPPKVPDPIPPAIAVLSSLHETIQSVTGPLQSTTANLESITRELITMNNTLRESAATLNNIVNPERDTQVEHPQSPQRPDSVLSAGYEPPNINQNARVEYPLVPPHPLGLVSQPVFSFAPAGSKSQNDAAEHGHATSLGATQQEPPGKRANSMRIEPQRRVDVEHEEMDLAPTRELPPPVGDTYNCFGFTLCRSSCQIC